MKDLEDEYLLKVKEKYEEQLLNIEGVTGVGANSSIIIYVEKLTPKLAAFLPKRLDEIPVKVIETGKIIPLPISKPIPLAEATYQARTGRFRPAPGGVSVGHPQISAGTLSCRAYDRRSGEVLGLSNNHVIAIDWGTEHIGKRGDPTLQPGPYDGGKEPQDSIGELERWIPVVEKNNLVDAAIFRSDLLSKEVYEAGVPSMPFEAKPNTKVLKSGRTSGITYGKVLDVNASVKVSGWGEVTFVDQITVQPAILSPGDSGSWVGEVDTLRTVGIGHAGSPSLSVISKAKHVESMLDINIIPPELWGIGYMPWYFPLGLIAGFFAFGEVVKKR